MSFILQDRVWETTSSSGTGAVTLSGPRLGYQSFSVIGDGNSTTYCITDGIQFEVGVGTYSAAGPALSRDIVYSSTNSNQLVNFSANLKNVFLTIPAEILIQILAQNQFSAEELISGGRAVSISPSGNVRIAMASVPSRMPAIGYVIDNVTSGNLVTAYTNGRIIISGSNFSGYVGSMAWVGTSGELLWKSSVPSGNIVQNLGVIYSASGLLFSHISSGGLITLQSGSVGSGIIANNAVVSGSIGSGQIGVYHLQSGLVTSGLYLSGSIGSGQISAAHLASGFILPGSNITITPGLSGYTITATGSSLTSGSVTSGYLGNSSVVSGSIGSGQVGVYHLQSGLVTSGLYLSGSIGSGQISAAHLASGFILPGSNITITPGLSGYTITASSTGLTSGSVTSGFLGNSSVVSGSIGSGQVGVYHLQSGLVTSGLYLSGSIGSGQISAAHLASGFILPGTNITITPGLSGYTINSTGSSLTSGSVQSGNIGSGAVQGYFGSTRNIASGTVGVYDFGSGAVLSGNIASGQIGVYHLQSGLVTSGLILSGSIGSGQVSTFHLASGSVQSGNIGIGAILSGNIGSGQIGAIHLTSGFILPGNNITITPGFSGYTINSITTLTSGQVLSGNIASGQISTYHLASGTTITRAQFTAPFVSGTPWTVLTEEPVSGVRAVALSQSGNVRIAMASISGRMPAIGIVVDNVASGIQANVYTAGTFQVTSGLADYSGYIGQSLYVGRSGQVVTASGSFNSGGLSSGDVIQLIGISFNSGNILAELGQAFQPVIVQSGNIGSGQVGAVHLAPNFILAGTNITIVPGLSGYTINSTTTLTSGQVLSGNIGSGQIGVYHLQSGLVTSGLILSGSIGSGQIGVYHLQSGLVTSGLILSGSIGSGQISTFHLASGSVQSGNIGIGAILSGNIGSGQIGAIHLTSGFILPGNNITITPGFSGYTISATGSSLTSGSVTSGFLGNSSVVSGSIGSGQIGVYHLQSGLVTSGLILSGSIGSGQVSTFHLASGSVQSGNIGIGAILSGNIGSGQIGAIHITSGFILPGNNITITPGFSGYTITASSAGVTSGSVTSGFLGNSSVVSGSIGSGQIGVYHLQSGLVTSGLILSGSIGSGQVSTFHLASGSVQSGNIGIGAIVSGSIGSGQIGTYHLASGATITRAQFTAPFVSGTSWTVLTEEPVSGVRAVALSQSGNVRIAMASISGRMPAVGIVVDNVASGIQTNVYTAGTFQVTSGLADYSGYIGQSLSVGRSGQIVTASGSFNSGGLVYGDIIQYIGTAFNSGSINLELGQAFQQIVALSGMIGSGQIGSVHIASGTSVTYSYHTFDDTFVCTEMISGAAPVCILSGGFLGIAQGGSGLRMPAIGISANNVTSGGNVTVILLGKVNISSGLYSLWSGSFGNPLYVSTSGDLMTPTHPITGIAQKIGNAISGGLLVNVGIMQSGQMAIQSGA